MADSEAEPYCDALGKVNLWLTKPWNSVTSTAVGQDSIDTQAGQPSLYQSLAFPPVRSDSDFGTLVLGAMNTL
jgi:hypothetical protein